MVYPIKLYSVEVLKTVPNANPDCLLQLLQRRSPTAARKPELTYPRFLRYPESFAVEVRRSSVAGQEFRLRFGCPVERGREWFRRNRKGKLNSFGLGGQVNTCSLSPVLKRVERYRDRKHARRWVNAGE